MPNNSGFILVKNCHDSQKKEVKNLHKKLYGVNVVFKKNYLRERVSKLELRKWLIFSLNLYISNFFLTYK